MKTLLLLTTSLFLTLLSKSQITFCPAGAEWRTIFTRSWPDQTLETETVVYTGTQVINGETVKVLTHTRFFLNRNFHTTASTYLKQVGDTVFVKNNRTFNKWQILYNFAAQTGDTWKDSLDLVGSGNPYPVSYTITVLSTQTVSINGQTLKQLTVNQKHSNSYRNNFNYTITERLGSELFLFCFGGVAVSDGDDHIENLCYTDDAFGTYQYSTKSCDYTATVGINEVEKNRADFLLYPNPANNRLKISGSASSSFQIVNTLGEVMMEGAISENNQEVAIDQLAAGVYFFRLQETGLASRNSVQRFVKTE